MKARTSAFILALLLAIAGLAAAQERFGALTGRVVDEQDSAVPGVPTTRSNSASTAAVQQLVLQRELYVEPAVRQLRGSREL